MIKYDNSIEKIASQFAEKYRYKIGDSLVQLVENKLNGKIEINNADQWIEKSIPTIEIYGNGKNPLFTIRIPSFENMLRNRFSIAHELGHFVLESNYGQKAMTRNRKGYDKNEQEYDYFAGALLMPENEFRNKYTNYNGDHYILSDLFKVSRSAVGVRKNVLGL